MTWFRGPGQIEWFEYTELIYFIVFHHISLYLTLCGSGYHISGWSANSPGWSFCVLGLQLVPVWPCYLAVSFSFSHSHMYLTKACHFDDRDTCVCIVCIVYEVTEVVPSRYRVGVYVSMYLCIYVSMCLCIHVFMYSMYVCTLPKMLVFSYSLRSFQEKEVIENVPLTTLRGCTYE